MTETPSTPTGPPFREFRYVWPVKISMRPLSDDDAVILHVSPKFATVHEHVAFQWSMKIHGTCGGVPPPDDDFEENVENIPDPTDYVAVELYFVDGPVNQVDIKAVVGIINKDAKENDPSVEEKRSLKMQRGHSSELTNTDRTQMSDHIKENMGKVVRFSLSIQLDSKMFDPYTYLDYISPTPMESFLTTNYKARVNSKVWRRRSKKKSHDHCRIPRQQKVDYEERFKMVMEKEEQRNAETNACSLRPEHRNSLGSHRRASTATLSEQLNQPPDDEHIFKKLLIACCDSCERRRASINAEDSRTEESEDDASSGEDNEEEESFECTESDKEHVHDLLANMYFNKVVLPEMEYVEDFVDFLIDAELNDLPVLKRACERYLCGELNTKKDLLTSLLLDLLFMSIVFNLNVMKSMTLSELSNRTEDLNRADKLLEEEEYKNLDRRIRTLSDRNLIELIEQCQAFREQKLRVTTVDQ